MAFFLAVPPALIALEQQGLLERSFYDGLFPALLFRQDIQRDEWPANTGTEIFETRPGLLAPVTKALVPGTDPTPQVVSYEQWSARLQRYAGTIDTNAPNSTTAMSDLFLRNIQQLGLQAGQSINRIARNFQFKAYLSGQTALTAAGAAGDTTIHVAAINGFQTVVIKGTNVRPQPVSTAYPLPITIAGVTGTRNVIGAIPDNPDDPDGPGTLVLSAALGGAGAVARAAVLSTYRPKVIRVGGGDSIDAIGSTDTLVLQSLIEGVNYLRKNNVQPHEDGFYHLHLPTDGNSQIFNDPKWATLNTALPDHVYYQSAFVGTIANFEAFLNNESPDNTNVGTLVQTGTNAFYGSDIGAEVINDSGIVIQRAFLTGRSHAYERLLDERKYVTEAGITGKLGEFNVVNNSIEVGTEGIRLVIRSPIDRLQDNVAATWSISTGYAMPTDITAGNNALYKRAVAIEFASNG